MIQLETKTDEAARLLDALAAVRRALGSEVAIAGTDEGLSTTQFLALRALSVRDRTASELARAIGVQLPSLTQVADSLVGRAWVERYSDQSDRRRVCLRLTDSGRDAYLLARRSAEDRMSRLIEHLSAREKRSLFRGLDALRLALIEVNRSGSKRRRNRTLAGAPA